MPQQYNDDLPKDAPESEAPPKKTFTGYRRDRKTHWSVAFKDRVAHVLITAGGLGTIAAVILMCAFLVTVVVPLFLNADIEERSDERRAWIDEAGRITHIALDDYSLLGWAAFADGTIRVMRMDNGDVIDTHNLAPDGVALSAWSFPQRGNFVMLGYEDGTVRRAEIDFKLEFIDADDAPPELQTLGVREVATHGTILAQMTPERQIRLLSLDITIHPPTQTGMDIPVIRLDHSSDGSAPTFVAMFADQSVQVHRLRFNRMRRQFDTTTTSGEVVIDDEGRGPPDYITTTGLGDNIYLIWREGILQRYDSRRLNNITLVETVDILPGEGAELTVVSNLIGRTTLLLGDSRGNVRGLFRVGPDRPVEYERRSLRPLLETVDDEEALLVLQEIMGTDTFRAEVDRELHASMGADNQTLAPVQLMSGDGAGAVTAISTSQRRRTIAVGHNDGRVRLHNVTNERLLAEIDTGHTEAVGRLVLNPRDSGLAAISGNRVQVWDVSAPHPESSMASLFTKVHYEGYSYPTHTWQSTGGTDNFESKYGMLPLIFGSLKATFFAMMFAVPVAIMAAIYTSEFLQPKMKSKVKPTIEMMASLPSVVLGFLAGLVVAQFIEDIVVAVLMAFFTVPFTFLLLSQIFQTLSAPVRMRIARWRFLVLILSLPIALYMAALVGPLVEGWLFWVEDPRAAVVLADGSIERNFTYNIRDWLSAHRQDFPVDASLPQFRSSAIGGWMILFMPVAALASLVLMTRYINPLMSTWAQQWTWSKLAFADAGKFLVVCLVAVVVAYLFSAIASLMVDGRGIFLDQYAQRNALIVGVIMGFAVIPIIYTIADDAMSAVPESLRSASLGAGATPWQTAVRVIIPTAMSGLFSAVMIGFGRAVGETMIVLMALGNTPIMELNIFSGARTLSANIAVEMMEAVKDSTNYRILFLAGLVLFIMTFVINTIAEAVRLHYRKKAAEL